MREIRVKIWKVKEKEMFGPIDLISYNATDLHWNILLIYGQEDEIIPLLWIGLKDKHIKEIYEGDVLSHDIAANRREIVIVIRSKFGWEFKRLNDGFYGYDEKGKTIHHIIQAWKYIDDCDIIGNIHENPELLEGKT